MTKSAGQSRRTLKDRYALPHGRRPRRDLGFPARPCGAADGEHGTDAAPYYRLCQRARVEYRSSSLTLTGKWNGPAQAGKRAPDAMVSVRSVGGEKRDRARIFELIDPAKFTLLLFDTVTPGDSSRNDEAAAAISEALPHPLDAWHVMATDGSEITAGYGMERPSFCLIRPDGYVMARGTPDEAVTVAAFCRHIFNRPLA